MHIPHSQAEKLSVPEGFIWDYEISKEIGVSYQELSGRGPDSGRYLNKECHEIFFMIEGEAVFVLNDERYPVVKNDVVVVEPGTPFYIEVEKYVRYITITRPDWFPEQYELLSE